MKKLLILALGAFMAMPAFSQSDSIPNAQPSTNSLWLKKAPPLTGTYRPGGDEYMDGTLFTDQIRSRTDSIQIGKSIFVDTAGNVFIFVDDSNFLNLKKFELLPGFTVKGNAFRQKFSNGIQSIVGNYDVTALGGEQQLSMAYLNPANQTSAGLNVRRSGNFTLSTYDSTGRYEFGYTAYTTGNADHYSYDKILNKDIALARADLNHYIIEYLYDPAQNKKNILQLGSNINIQCGETPSGYSRLNLFSSDVPSSVNQLFALEASDIDDLDKIAGYEVQKDGVNDIRAKMYYSTIIGATNKSVIEVYKGGIILRADSGQLRMLDLTGEGTVLTIDSLGLVKKEKKTDGFNQTVAGGQESGFTSTRFEDSTFTLVFVNGTLLLPSQYSVNPGTGAITFTPALTVGDDLSILVVYNNL